MIVPLMMVAQVVGLALALLGAVSALASAPGLVAIVAATRRRPRRLALGPHEGWVTVRGRVRLAPGESLRAFRDQRPVVYRRLTVTGHNGGRVATRQEWTDVVPFIVEDDGVEVLVRGSSADLVSFGPLQPEVDAAMTPAVWLRSGLPTASRLTPTWSEVVVAQGDVVTLTAQGFGGQTLSGDLTFVIGEPTLWGSRDVRILASALGVAAAGGALSATAWWVSGLLQGPGS